MYRAGRLTRALIKQPDIPHEVTLFTDGASRGNPGPSGAGGIIYGADGDVLLRMSSYLGVRTCNYAEYMGVLRGLIVAKALKASKVKICTDSELLVKHVTGEYVVRHPSLKELRAEVTKRARSFQQCQFSYVPRGQNVLADSLANLAVDTQRKFCLELEDPMLKVLQTEKSEVTAHVLKVRELNVAAVARRSHQLGRQ